MLSRLLTGPSSPVLAGAVIVLIFLLGKALLDRGALSDPVTYLIAALLGNGFALATAWRRRRARPTV